MNCAVWILLATCIQFSVCFKSSENSVETADEGVDDVDKLIFAHVIFRHGERNIDASYPTDPYKDEKYWPDGFGALTNVGKQEVYELGKYLRRRYKQLIGVNYSSKNVYIRSTDIDRTLMSAQIIAAALFPPSEEQMWNKELKWQPIPIHTRSSTEEHLLAWMIPCPRFMYLFKNEAESIEVKSLIEKHKFSIEHWEKHAGKSFQKLFDLMFLYDTLYVENRKGLILPEWADIALKSNNTLETLAATYLGLFTHTKELQKLQIGSLMKEMLDHFKNKTLSLLQPDRSLWIYAAHDLTIINVLNAFNLFEFRMPQYASSLHFELYQRNMEYYVQLSFKSLTMDQPKLLNIPNCGTKCLLDKVHKLIEDIIPAPDEDYNTLCRMHTS